MDVCCAQAESVLLEKAGGSVRELKESLQELKQKYEILCGVVYVCMYVCVFVSASVRVCLCMCLRCSTWKSVTIKKITAGIGIKAQNLMLCCVCKRVTCCV
jgi:hypothetical protein